MPKWMKKPEALGGIGKNIDFEVEFANRKGSAAGAFYFHNFDKAAGQAVRMAASGSKVHLNVLIHSESAAYAWGGEDAAARYREDPDASVSQRIIVKADDQGRVA